jgi:hypothetical protein
MKPPWKWLNKKDSYPLLGLVFVAFLAYRVGPGGEPLCVTLSIGGTTLCLPKSYLSASYNPAQVGPKSVNLEIPVVDLPISPSEEKYATVHVGLSERVETFAERKANAIQDYQQVHKPNYTLPAEENGMTVLSVDPSVVTAWTGEFLYPANGDPAYFWCGRPWATRWGTDMGAGCQAIVDWDQTSMQPHVEVTFSMDRKDLAHWKRAEAQVRQFLSKYTVKDSTITRK